MTAKASGRSRLPPLPIRFGVRLGRRFEPRADHEALTREIEAYFRAWEVAVAAFGSGQVSTYVILGMGEDPATTVAACRRAVDLGVYPFIVPLRPVPGSLMADQPPPSPEYVESIYRQVVPYMTARGLSATGVMAGCARCQACSGMAAMEREVHQAMSGGFAEGGLTDGRHSLPLVF